MTVETYAESAVLCITEQSESNKTSIPSGIWLRLYGCRWAAINTGAHDGLWLVGDWASETFFLSWTETWLLESQLAACKRRD